MTSERVRHRVLVVSAGDSLVTFLTELLPASDYAPLLRARNAGEARRMMLDDRADIVVINTPLPDEFGTSLALDAAEGTVGVLLLVKTDCFDEICYRVEDSGVFTLAKPSSRQNVYSAIRLLTAMHQRLQQMETKNRTLQEKMADIRMVNRAKWLLIEHLRMSEQDAHYFIEKQAMDARLSRREVAERIIHTYDT